MNRDIKSYMSDKTESFDAVLAAIDDLIDAQFILAESKITALLQKTAASLIAYNLLDDALSGFDYVGEFTRAMQRTAIGTHTLVLPTDNRSIVSFVFCLLLDIDTKKCNFGDFLHTYFYRETPGGEFALFIKTMIEPYKAALKALHSGEAETADQDSLQEEPIDNSEEIKALFGEVKALSDKLTAARIESADKDEAAFALGALSRALSSSDGDGIRLAYVALKNTVAGKEPLKTLADDINSIGEKLIALGVIAAA